MSYKLGTRSLQNLSGVHPDMVAVVKKAIEITEVDFCRHGSLACRLGRP
mgnify:CR=1 FL=1